MAVALGFKAHEAANIFPMLEGDEFDELVKDIKANGVVNPVVYDADGNVVDGRNRLRAARKAGIPEDEIPKKRLNKSMTTRDIYELVLTENVYRRHLNKEERAARVIDVMRKFGELDELEKASEEEAKLARAEHMKNLNEARKAGTKLKAKPPKRGPNRVGTTVAKKAGVSLATANRTLQLEKKDPVTFSKLASGTKEDRRGKGGPKLKWSVPKDPAECGAVLAERYSMEELTRLVKAIIKVAPKVADIL